VESSDDLTAFLQARLIELVAFAEDRVAVQALKLLLDNPPEAVGLHESLEGLSIGELGDVHGRIEQWLKRVADEIRGSHNDQEEGSQADSADDLRWVYALDDAQLSVQTFSSGNGALGASNFVGED